MVDMTNDVIRFEEMFTDRFTESDKQFMELKSKKLPNPVVIYPWKITRKQWNKRWDYGSKKNQDQRERGDNRNDNRQARNSYNRSWDHYGESARDGHYRDHSQDNRRDNYRDRSQDSRRNSYRDRSYDNRRDNYREDHNKPFDFQAALKAYKER